MHNRQGSTSAGSKPQKLTAEPELEGTYSDGSISNRDSGVTSVQVVAASDMPWRDSGMTETGRMSKRREESSTSWPG